MSDGPDRDRNHSAVKPSERMFNAVWRREVDVIPFSTYNCHPFSWGRHIADPGYGAIIAKIRSTSVGCLCKVHAPAHSDTPLIETQEEVRGADTYTTSVMHTPKGPLNSVRRQPAGQPGMCIKHFIEGPADVEKYLSAEHTAARWELSALIDQVDEIGDKGVAYLDYEDPFNSVAVLFDQEDFALRTITDAGLIESLIEREFQRIYTDLGGLLDELSENAMPLLFYTGGPEKATPPLLSPGTFHRFIVPYQSRLVDLIHSYGYPVSLHCHGRVKEVLPHILECGFDVLEPLEPPPQGNIDLEELRRRVAGQITLMGYIQDQDFYLLKAQEIRDRVRRIRDLIGSDSGFVGSPTCTPFQHPPGDTYVANYIAFLDEACALVP